MRQVIFSILFSVLSICSMAQSAVGKWKTIDDKTAWICNDCRFEKKDPSKWNILGPRKIDRHSVISQGKYATKNDQNPKLLS